MGWTVLFLKTAIDLAISALLRRELFFVFGQYFNSPDLKS
jgi:hypothetical protein